MPGFSGQGIVSIAPRLASGLPGVFRDFGNASVFKISQQVQTVERQESRSGARLPLRRLTKSVGGTLQIVGDEFNKDNFALSVLGTASAVVAGQAVAGYVLPNPVAVGDTVILPAKAVSAVAIKDSSGAPKVLPGTGYELDLFAGSIKFKEITQGGPYVQPFTADFTPGPASVIGAFKNTTGEFYVRLDGVNTDDANKRGICDVFRVRINPAKALDLISNDYLDFDLECAMLADLTRSAAAADGQFFGWYQA